jgi:polysaccharide pyruvyl transferase WcaK-like protein
LEPVDIALISFHPQSDRAALSRDVDGIEIHDAFPKVPSRFSAKWFINTFNRRVLMGSPPYYPFFNRALYRRSNVVMHIGGDNFCYGHDQQTWFNELAFASSYGALTVIWAASIGPFGREDEDKYAQQLRKIDLITVREELTFEYLQKIGVVDNVRMVGDPAFLLPATSDGAVRMSGMEGDIIVGIGMNALISDFVSGPHNYLEAFTQFGKELLLNPKIRLMLIPHVIDDSKTLNDLAVCESLANCLSRPDRVMVLGSDHNACQTKYVISQCHYFIGARTHSTIASLSTGVPTLTIAYSTKGYGINRNIFGHTDYVVPISSLNGNILLKKFNLLYHNRQKIVEHLVKSKPALCEAADKGGRYLSELLRMTTL